MMRCAGDEQPGAGRCEPSCGCRVGAGLLAALVGALFLLAAAGQYGQLEDMEFLTGSCGADWAGGGDDFYYDMSEYDGCDCDSVMQAQYGADDTCMVRYGTEQVQDCCESVYSGASGATFLGAILLLTAPMMISGGWLPVCGVLGDCGEAFASCNRVVTDEPAPCCWRDCTMIWCTPVWLMSLVLLPLHLVRTEDFDAGANSAWLYLTVLVNGAYMVLTVIFALKPCVPPGHDAASRQARLTSKLLNQCVCAGIVVYCVGLFFALLAFVTTAEANYSMPCCYCVTDGQADLELLSNDSSGRCECRMIDDGLLVERWMYDDYISSLDPNLGTAAAQGTISDGGDDMYDGGNYLSTSLCSAGGLAPYTTGMNAMNSDCFGPNGQYRMDLRETMMVVVAKAPAQYTLNTLSHLPESVPEWDFTVNGNLGADGSGQVHIHDDIPSQSGLKAFAKTVCARNDASITHLIVVEDTTDVRHSTSPNTDLDYDAVNHISPTSGLVYVMAAKQQNRCPTREDIVGLFSSVVAMCTASQVSRSNTLAKGCAWLNWGEEAGEADLVLLEQSWTNGHRIAWDLEKVSPPLPPAPLTNCTTTGVFYRFSHTTSAPTAIGDYYYHVSNVYGGGSDGRYTGQHEWRADSGERIVKTFECGMQVWAIAKPVSTLYSEGTSMQVDCWSVVGTNFDTPPEVGWKCVNPHQRLCDHLDVSAQHGTIESGLRLRSSSFCIDGIGRTPSQCLHGDQNEALSDISGAMDGWENCDSAYKTLTISRFGHCGGQTKLVDLLSAYLDAAQDTAETPQSMQEAGLDPLATFQDVCCETCPPSSHTSRGTFDASPPPPAPSYEPREQQHSSPLGMHPSSCPHGGNGGSDARGQQFFASATTFLSLVCINVSFCLVGHFQCRYFSECCSRTGGVNSSQTQGRCSMVVAILVAWLVLIVVDFFGLVMLASPPPPEVLYMLCVVLPSAGILVIFNAHHCSLQAPVQTVQAVVTSPMVDFQVATVAASPTVFADVAESTVMPIAPTAAGVPAAHASASRQSATLMPSLGEALVPTAGFSLESSSDGVHNRF